MNSYVAPKFNLEAFNCPFCNAYTHMTWTSGSGWNFLITVKLNVVNVIKKAYGEKKNISIIL